MGFCGALLGVQDGAIQFLIILVTMAVAVAAPRYLLTARIKARQQAIQNQMPNVMDVLLRQY